MTRIEVPEVSQLEWLRLGMFLQPILQVQQVLAPVNVAVDQMRWAARRTASQFIEVRQAVGVNRQATDDRPCERAGGKARCKPMPLENGRQAADPDEAERKDRQYVAHVLTE